jgi:hypothetical protein
MNILDAQLAQWGIGRPNKVLPTKEHRESCRLYGKARFNATRIKFIPVTLLFFACLIKSSDFGNSLMKITKSHVDAIGLAEEHHGPALSLLHSTI